MAIDILMPALSPTMEEGTLAKWLVKEGDKVKSGDVLAEIETDKATMEVEAVDEGIIGKILVPAGSQNVKVNAPIAILEVEGGGPSKKAKAAPAATPSSAAPAAVAAAPVAASVASAPGKADHGPRVLASPLAKRIASNANVDLRSVRGTGPSGRIVKADVEAALASGGTSRALTTMAAAPAAAPQAQFKSLESYGIAPGSYDLVPLDGMRRTIARRLTDSFRDVPHFPLQIDLEIDKLLEARARLNTVLEPTGVKVSVNDFVIRAAALTLKVVPQANASFTPDGIAMHHHADIAVAVAIDGGLITPIVRKAETKGLAQIAAEMKDLAERARNRKLKPEDYQGGTFSISNLGMFGIKSFASIINEPQGCIMSVGAGEKRAVVHKDQIVAATVMTVTLTCDHRVVDGSVGASFMKAFKGFIEDPLAMLA